MEKNFRILQRFAYVLMIIIMSYIILTKLKHILYPIALALLFSYLLYPLVSLFENKLRFPRTLAILLSILIGIAVFTGVANLFIIQVGVFIKDFPTFKDQAVENLLELQTLVETKFHFSVEEQEIWLQNQLDLIFDTSGAFLKKMAKGATLTLETILFIPIFSFFMLFFRDRGKTFILKLAKVRNSKLTEDLLQQISKVTIKYMVGVITVVAILSITHSIALSIIGVKYAIVLGLMAAVLSFIPYFGTMVSTIIPLSFSLILSSHPYEPLFVVIYFVVITFIDHNILTPTITGGNVNLNPLVTIISLVIAAEVWGITGMIIVVPTIAIIKIICDNVEGLEPYGYILGITKHGVDFKKIKKTLKKE